MSQRQPVPGRATCAAHSRRMASVGPMALCIRPPKIPDCRTCLEILRADFMRSFPWTNASSQAQCYFDENPKLQTCSERNLGAAPLLFMKLKPQTELKFLAWMMIFMALFLLGTLFVSIPGYHFILESPWEKLFRTEAAYLSFLNAYRWLVLCCPPAFSALFIVFAWCIFKNLKRMRIEIPTA